MARKKKVKGPLPKDVNNNMVAEHNPSKIWGKGPLKIFDIELDCSQIRATMPTLAKERSNISHAWAMGNWLSESTPASLASKQTLQTRGNVALIYEQLGYERVKGPDAIRLLVESYLAEEVRKWAKEFPDELFFQMDRIYGNIKTTSRNRPKYYAKFIRKYIYEPIEKGRVLKELDRRNPTDEKGNRAHRHHSELSEEKGVLVLRSLIWQVVGVLKTSAGKPQFERGFARLMGQSVQESLFEDQFCRDYVTLLPTPIKPPKNANPCVMISAVI